MGFVEKPRGRWLGQRRFSGQPAVLDRIDGDSISWEQEPLRFGRMDSWLPTAITVSARWTRCVSAICWRRWCEDRALGKVVVNALNLKFWSGRRYSRATQG